ncbi:MAG: SpoIIE family protein phosphatase [Acidobacteriaceae bacterium]
MVITAPRFSRVYLALVAIAASLALALPACANTLTVQNPGTGVTQLGGTWQFHLGDNLAWANPALDDSHWEPISADKPWGAQTHPSYTGFAWYRRHITIDNSGSEATKNLAVLIPPVDDVYDLYWNGKKIGSYGAMPPHANWWQVGHSAVYKLPPSPETGVLALRVWKATLSSVDPSTNGGFEAVPLLGDADVLAAQSRLPMYRRDEHRLPDLLISAVVLVAGFLSFLLFFRDRKQGLYLWLAIYLVAGGLIGVRDLSAYSFALTFRSTQLVTQLLECAQDISIWFILLFLFGLARDPRWKRATAWLVSLYLAAQIIDIGAIFIWYKGWPSLPWIDAVTTAVYSITPLYVFVIIGYGLTRRKQLRLWPLIAAACLNGLYNCVLNLVGQGVRFTHWTLNARIQSIGLHAGGFFFGIAFILNTLLFLALIFTIAREQFLERERQSRMELELKSAQEVQKVLVPETTPAIPGFAIASIYRPAEEVGGDFFQVIPLANGSALVILGDVSGKGLKAAMTVSLIVGTLRTLVDYTQSPSEILSRLNRRLIGRTDGGFVTCLAARVDADGSVALANAGHLSPFHNADEMPVTSSLPLGLAPDAKYEEANFRLRENDSLTFYTDGVVEAQNQSGELFGFERVAALAASNPTVEEIVETARAFGQKDDITVLRLVRLPQTAPAHTATIRMATQIAGA